MLENDEKNKLISKQILRMFLGHVDCNFAEPSGKKMIWKFRPGFVRTISSNDRAFSFQKESFHTKSCYEKVQSSFDNPAGICFDKRQKFFPFQEQTREKKTKIFKKKLYFSQFVLMHV